MIRNASFDAGSSREGGGRTHYNDAALHQHREGNSVDTTPLAPKLLYTVRIIDELDLSGSFIPTMTTTATAGRSRSRQMMPVQAVPAII